MRLLLTTMTISGLLFLAACSSSPKTQEKKLRPGEPDPNKHLDGATDVIQNYRLPEGGKKPLKRPTFQDKTRRSTKPQEEEKPPK
jgi:hypothetical protein